MHIEVIFVDFNNADEKGRVRLTTNGSLNDIKNKNIELVEGNKVLLDDSEELKTLGTLYFSNEENIWVAVINWDDIQHYK